MRSFLAIATMALAFSAGGAGVHLQPAFAGGDPAPTAALPTTTVEVVADKNRPAVNGDHADKAKETAATASEAKKTPKKLPLIEQRRRAAEQQRLLLQEKALRGQSRNSEQQLERLRDQQAESLRLQQEQQRRAIYQARRSQQPSTDPTRAPRLTPLDRPLYDQTHPSCGVPGMPLC